MDPLVCGYSTPCLCKLTLMLNVALNFLVTEPSIILCRQVRMDISALKNQSFNLNGEAYMECYGRG